MDGFRGLAVLAVLVFHNYRVPLGWVGVDLFFVLSGFLITRILLVSKARSDYFRSFYVRRALRIFPVYYLLLLVAYCVDPAVGHRVWWFAAYLSDFTPLFPDMAVRALHHTWSLAVEEQFYLLWPLLIWVCPGRWLSAVCVALLVLVELTRVCAVPLGASVAFVNYNIATRCDGLLVGAWLAAQVVHGVRPNPGNIRVSRAVLAGALLVIAALIATRKFSVSQNPNVWMQGLGMWAVAFGACAAVWLGMAGEVGRFGYAVLQFKPLVYVGRISYGLYLWHQPILIWAKERFFEPSSLREHLLLGTSVSVVSLLVAMLSFRYFEAPILSLRRARQTAPG